MKNVAILISDNLLPDATEARPDRFELIEQMSKLTPAFAAQGITLETVRWREAAELADQYDAMLPLFVWDYFEGNENAFLKAMAQVDAKTRLLNKFDLLHWNSDKSYLSELETLGAPVIPSIEVSSLNPSIVDQAFDTLSTDTLVIKPQIGGGAWRQALYSKGEPYPDLDLLPPAAAMIQPYLPSVVEEGEYTFLFFGGKFSHALIKRPKAGDYRIQSIYGGTEETYHPTETERKAARDVLNTLDDIPLYARVDLLRGRDGQLKLIELEMIEPYLYLTHAPGEGAENLGAQRLAKALLARLG